MVVPPDDPHRPARRNVGAHTPRRFVYVWSAFRYRTPVPQSEAQRSHIVRRTVLMPGSFRRIPKTYCSKYLPFYETSPYPHPDLPLCPRCKEISHHEDI